MSDEEQHSKLRDFYHSQAGLYDLSRWSFLFGRRQVIRQVAGMITPNSILEVGCGTGTNLRYLAQCFPGAQLTGVDLSEDMLRVAEGKLKNHRDRVSLQHCAFDVSFEPAQRPDLIVFSYVLSMMNPGREDALETAGKLLADDGMLAIVDFDTTPWSLYRRYMSGFHVCMDGQLLPMLMRKFQVRFQRQRAVYAGMWRYFMFIGSKQP